jgi:hypothetical protein
MRDRGSNGTGTARLQSSQDSPFDTDRVHQDMLVFDGTGSGVQAEGRSSEHFSLQPIYLTT